GARILHCNDWGERFSVELMLRVHKPGQQPVVHRVVSAALALAQKPEQLFDPLHVLLRELQADCGCVNCPLPLAERGELQKHARSAKAKLVVDEAELLPPSPRRYHAAPCRGVARRQVAHACRAANAARIEESPHRSMCGRCQAGSVSDRRMGCPFGYRRRPRKPSPLTAPPASGWPWQPA